MTIKYRARRLSRHRWPSPKRSRVTSTRLLGNTGYQLVTASSRLSSEGATTTLTGLSPGTEVAVSIVAFDRAGHRTEAALTASFETLGGCVEVGASVPRTVQARAP